MGLLQRATRQPSHRAWLPAIALSAVLGPGLVAGAEEPAACTLDYGRLHRGESRPFLVCGPGITPETRVGSLEGVGIDVVYQQVLGRCRVGAREPGLYLWLKAGAGARSAALELRSPGGGQPCPGLRVEVPDQVLLPPARLRPATRRSEPGTAYRLELDAGELAGAGNCQLGFLADPRWPRAQVAPGDEVRPWATCPRRLRARITLEGEQRFPVPVVVSARQADGRGLQGVAWFQPPVPDWESALAPAAARFRTVLGYRTRYFDTEPGASPGRDTLVLVHGGQPDPVAPTAESWRANVPGLARHFRVIAYDSLGHGATENPRTPADYGRYYELVVEHLAALVADLGLRRVHLAGHSQGGWPVLRLALDRPDIVKCVVSVDSVMAPFTPGTPAVQYFAYAVTQIHPAAGPNVYSLMRGEEFIGQTLNNVSLADAERQLQWSRQPKFAEAKAALGRIQMSPGNPYFRGLREQATVDLAAGRLKVPHLLYWGREDQLAPLDLGLNLYATAARSPAPVALHVVNQAGHSPQVEHPAAFVGAVAGFCGQFRAGGPG